MRVSLSMVMILNMLMLHAQLRLEPTNWWTNLGWDTLELMVHYPHIQGYRVLVGPEVETLDTIHPDNPNYLFVRILIPDYPEDTTVQLRFVQGRDTQIRVYPLLRWDPIGVGGLDPSDLIYLITPDRFCDGDSENNSINGLSDSYDPTAWYGRHGGDLKGIERQLDYINQLGVTALWLNPVLENNNPKGSYHGYGITDFYAVDPRYGTNEGYRELAAQARDKGIKLVMDQVLNHCGIGHPWVTDLPDAHWFNSGLEFTPTNHLHGVQADPYAAPSQLDGLTKGWFVPSMPDLDQRMPQLANYLIQHSIWWTAYLGLDAIRLDTYPYSDQRFMHRWSCAMKACFPRLTLIGEETTIDPVELAYWQQGSRLNQNQGCLESLLDFGFRYQMSLALSEEEVWGQGLSRLYQYLGNDLLFNRPDQLVIFPDNHDMDRFLRQMGGDTALFKMGMGICYTMRGIPQILYGTELAFTNADHEHHGQIRADMPFLHAAEADLDAGQRELVRFFRELGAWRKTSEAVQRGTLMHYVPHDGIYVYFRYTQNETLMVVVNKNKEARSLELEEYGDMLRGKTMYRSYCGRLKGRLDQGLAVPPRSTTILEIDPAR